MTSVMREVFSQAPIGEREGAIALGATRWGMIRSVVMPVRPGGIIGGTCSASAAHSARPSRSSRSSRRSFEFTTHPSRAARNTIAAQIAIRYSESSGVALSALLAAGLVLFVVTLVINTIAGDRGQPVALRRRDGDLR